MTVTVYEKAIERIEYTFRTFEHVYVSFSGGKDSGVLLNLVLDYARKTGNLHRLSVMHIDYEIQYEETIHFVDSTLQKLEDLQVAVYRICLPLVTPCCVNMTQDHWKPWEENKKHVWVREMPVNSINIRNAPDFFYEGMRDYEFQDKFGGWLKNKLGVNTIAAMIGIRMQESLQRFSAIEGRNKVHRFDNKKYTSLMCGGGVINVYPIYDWKTEDIWTCNAKNGYEYNKLYDLFYLAGVPFDKMRVASPFLGEGISSLHLYKAINPNTWGKMVSRVQDVNFPAIYGNTKAMGHNNITKPAHFTWKQYLDFLLNTSQENHAQRWREIIETSITFWNDSGAHLSQETITRLQTKNIPLTAGKPKEYRTNKKPVTMPYMDDIDDPDFMQLPTWKRACIMILKNDYTGKTMGFGPTKIELDTRKKILKKYVNL